MPLVYALHTCLLYQLGLDFRNSYKTLRISRHQQSHSHPNYGLFKQHMLVGSSPCLIFWTSWLSGTASDISALRALVSPLCMIPFYKLRGRLHCYQLTMYPARMILTPMVGLRASLGRSSASASMCSPWPRCPRRWHAVDLQSFNWSSVILTVLCFGGAIMYMCYGTNVCRVLGIVRTGNEDASTYTP